MKRFPVKNFLLRNLLIWPGFQARCWYWFAAIDARLPQEEQERLHLHEALHARQMKRFGLLTYAWKYTFNREFRFAVEFEAYHEIDFLLYHKFRDIESLEIFVRAKYNC